MARRQITQAQITIDTASAIPARRQIVDQLRAALVNGVPGPGDELPSVRRLAIDLGIHFNTVAEAYRTLAEEGWLEVSHGRAARVRQREKPAAPNENAVEQYRQRIRHLVAEMRAQGLGTKQIAGELLAAVEGIK